MDALIFDFDGVVVDSEPVHLASFQQVLGPAGIEMSQTVYYTKYLGFDDRDAIRVCAADQGVELSEAQVVALIEAKTRLVHELFSDGIAALPGVVKLIHEAHGADVPLGICSGALLAEIEQAARTVGVWDCFDVVIPAEDVSRGKPDPSGYELTRTRLAEARECPVAAERCVVVEDSPAGIEAAHAAGMRVLAVTNSYPADALAAAERIVASLQDVDLAALAELY
ncbi:MAG: HAD family phosphatase [Phycisphaerae bacterium]|nr:HAD family phosphatase [Phycisphaerae bacterium]